MATRSLVQDLQNNLVDENKTDSDKDYSFLDAINTDESSAEDLDKRFFTGASDRPEELRTNITKATGYRAFKTYYDEYVENNKAVNSSFIPMNKDVFDQSIKDGLVDGVDEGAVSGGESRFVPFAENMTYEDKIKAMTKNQARQLEYIESETDTDININVVNLPINNLLNKFSQPVVDKKDPLRLPQGKEFYTDLEGNRVNMPEAPMFGKPGEKGKIVVDYENPALLFKNFLDKKTNIPEYGKAMLIKAQATGGFMNTDESLESFRTVNYAKDVPRLAGNLSLFILEGAANTMFQLGTIGLSTDETPDILKTFQLDPSHLDYGSEIFSKRTGIDVETAERILDWSPDWIAPIKREFVAGLPIAGALSLSKFGSVMLRNSGFKTFVKNKYGGKTFEESFKKGMKDGDSYDSMLTGYAETGFNSPLLNSWKKSSTIDAINSVSTMKNYSRKIDTTDIDNIITAKKVRVKEMYDRRLNNNAYNEQYKKEAKELAGFEARKRDMWLMSRVPKKFLNVIKTEAFPAVGVGLSKHTHQEYFPEQSETMFEFGGIALGLYGEKVVFGRSGSMRSVLTGIYKKVAGTSDGISSSNKQIAEEFVGNLYAKNERLAAEFEQGVTQTLAIENRLLSLRDAKGLPIINSPDLISKTIENINVLNILKQTTGNANNSIRSGDVTNFSDKFTELQTKLIDQKQLNDELATAISKLSALETSPNITEADLSFIKGLKLYTKDSQTSLKTEIDEFYTSIDDSEALLLLKANGANIGENVLQNTGELRKSLHLTRKQMDLALGKSAKQISDEANIRLATFDSAINELTNAATNVKRKTTAEISKITGVTYESIKHKSYEKASHGFTVLREQNKDTFMDASGVLDTLLDKVNDSLLLGTDAAKRLGGTKLSAVQNSQMGRVLNDAADMFFNKRPELTEAINAIKTEYPNATSLEIWGALKDESLAAGKDIMKLPLNFIDFELVASGLSSVIYKKSGTRASLPVRELRKSMYDAAENSETGFRVGFFDESGGVLVAKKTMDDYKLVKGAYEDHAMRYDNGTVGGSWDSHILGKSKGQTQYATGADPANWVASEMDKYLKAGDDVGLSTNFISDMASVFGGSRVKGGDKVAYEFFEEASGTKNFKNLMKNNMKLMVMRSTVGGKEVMKLRDSPVFREKFLTSTDIMDGRMLVGKNDEQTLMEVIRAMRSATVKTQDGKTVKMFSEADFDEVFDTVGVEELTRVSQNAKIVVKNALEGVRNKVDIIRSPKSKEAKLLLQEMDMAVKYSDINKPDGIAKALSGGRFGLDELDSVRNSHIRELGSRGIVKGSPEFIKEVNMYDKMVAKQTMEFIKTGSVQPVMGASGTAARAIPTKVNPEAMWRRLGGSNDLDNISQEAQAIRAILKRASGSDELYENMKAISALVAGRSPGSSSGVKLTGIPRGLSVESYISRVYSMAREVVSFKYVATEAVLQTMRMRKFNAYEAMIDNPEIAEHVIKIMKSGQPLTEKLATNFLQLMTNAVAKQIVKYEGSENSALNLNKGVDKSEDGLFSGYEKMVKEGEEKGYIVGAIDRETMKVQRDGELTTPNLKALQPGPVGPKFDIRKKPEYLGGDVDFNPEPLTATEKLFGRVVR